MTEPTPPSGGFRVLGRSVKFQFGAAAHKLYVSAGVSQQPGEIDGGSASADDGDTFTAKGFEVFVAIAVGQKFLGQVRQIFRDVFEVRNTNRENHAAGFNGFSTFEAGEKSFGGGDDIFDEALIEFGQHALAKGESVGAKCFDANGNSGVRVFDSLFRAKFLQSEYVVGIVDVRGEAIRLEATAFRHVGDPTVHGAAKDAEGDSATAKMGGNR